MDDNGLVFGFVLGIAAMWGYQHWNTPMAISNAEAGIEGSVALTKFMSGQVALIHGFVDDYDVCLMMKDRLERDGGIYGCVPENSVQKNP